MSREINRSVMYWQINKVGCVVASFEIERNSCSLHRDGGSGSVFEVPVINRASFLKHTENRVSLQNLLKRS